MIACIIPRCLYRQQHMSLSLTELQLQRVHLQLLHATLQIFIGPQRAHVSAKGIVFYEMICRIACAKEKATCSPVSLLQRLCDRCPAS